MPFKIVFTLLAIFAGMVQAKDADEIARLLVLKLQALSNQKIAWEVTTKSFPDLEKADLLHSSFSKDIERPGASPQEINVLKQIQMKVVEDSKNGSTYKRKISLNYLHSKDWMIEINRLACADCDEIYFINKNGLIYDIDFGAKKINITDNSIKLLSQTLRGIPEFVTNWRLIDGFNGEKGDLLLEGKNSLKIFSKDKESHYKVDFDLNFDIQSILQAGLSGIRWQCTNEENKNTSVFKLIRNGKPEIEEIWEKVELSMNDSKSKKDYFKKAVEMGFLVSLKISGKESVEFSSKEFSANYSLLDAVNFDK